MFHYTLYTLYIICNSISLSHTQCQAELNKIPLFDADLFNGIERRNIDVKNPLPTKYPLCLLVRVKDNNKFLCADSAEDRLLISAAVIFSKVQWCVGGHLTFNPASR